MNKEKHHPLCVLKGGVGSVPKIQTCIFGVLVDDAGSPIIPYLCEVKQHANWDHVVSLCHVFITASTVKTVSGNGNPKQPNKVNSIHGPSFDAVQETLWRWSL